MIPPAISKKKRPGSAKARNNTQGNTGKAVTSKNDDMCDTCSCKLPPQPKYNRNTSVNVVTSRMGQPMAETKVLLPFGASSPMACCRMARTNSAFGEPVSVQCSSGVDDDITVVQIE